MAGEITDIRPQKRKRDRVNVYLDGEYTFTVGTMVAPSLRRGDSLSDEEIEELQMQDSVQTAYDRTLKYLAYRPRSTGEVRRYLREKRVPEQAHEQVLERLSAVGLLDDLAFVQYWVENRETFRPRGRRLLRQELRQKGIGNELIAEALREVDEEKSARRAALKRRHRYAQLDDEGFRHKMYSFLRGRGFAHEVIRETISHLLHQRREEGAERS